MATKQKRTTTNQPKAVEDNQRSILFSVFIMVGLFVVGMFLYQPIMQHRFLDWDDQLYVTENPLVLQPEVKSRSTIWNTPIALNYHPLTILTLQWDRNRAGDLFQSKQSAKPFLQTNRLIHALNSSLVFLVLMLFTKGRWFPSIFAAMAFLVHPMHVESVAWVSERKDVLYTLFFLLSATAYLQFIRQRRSYWWFGSFLLFVLACLSKAMAVSLVPVLFLLDEWENRSFKELGIWIEKIPFLLTGLLVGWIAVDIQAGGNFHGIFSNIEGVKAATGNAAQFGIWERLQYASYGMTQYLLKFFAPIQLSPFYPYPEASINRGTLPAIFPLSVLIFSTLVFLSVWSRRFSKVFFFSFAFYFFTVVLVAQFLSVGLVIMADRYSYVPYIGVGLGVGFAIDWITGSKQLGRYGKWLVMLGFALWWGYKTQTQLKVWKDTESLWKSALEKYPKDGQILANLGNYYGKNGRIDEAASCFEQAIEAKIQNAMVYEGLGNVYGSRNDHQKAAEMFTEAIRIDPRRGNFYFNRGTAYTMFAPEKAIPDFEKSLELLPPAKHAEVFVRIANTYLQQKEYTKAIASFDRSIALGPPSASVLHDRGVAKFNLGQRAEAIADFKAALQVDPQFQVSRNTLLQLGELK